MDHEVIPRKLHFIWFGRVIPDELTERKAQWVKLHPEWETRVWGFTNMFDLSYLEDEFDAAETFKERTRILAWEILYRYGGVFVDFSLEALRNITPLLEGPKAVLMREPGGLVDCRFYASVSHHQLLRMICALAPTYLRKKQGYKLVDTCFQRLYRGVQVLEPPKFLPDELPSYAEYIRVHPDNSWRELGIAPEPVLGDDITVDPGKENGGVAAR